MGSTLLPGHGEAARVVAFSPDGQSLAVGCNDGVIRLWDFKAAQLTKTLTTHTRFVSVLSYSARGEMLASAALDYTAILWDSSSGRLLRHWTDYGNSGVRGLAFDPQGQWLATASPNASVKLRDLKSDKVWANFSGRGGAVWMTLSPSGKALAVGRITSESAEIYIPDFRATTAEVQKRIQALIEKWEDDSFEIREKASNDLKAMGLVAVPLLTTAIKEGPSTETRMRARLARDAIQSPEPAALLQGHA
jgi:WD40 repeat protein